MQKAIGYIRVSTQGQADEGVSLEAQRAKIRAWCELNDAELVAVFEDAGLSGASIRASAQAHGLRWPLRLKQCIQALRIQYRFWRARA